MKNLETNRRNLIKKKKKNKISEKNKWKEKKLYNELKRVHKKTLRLEQSMEKNLIKYSSRWRKKKTSNSNSKEESKEKLLRKWNTSEWCWRIWLMWHANEMYVKANFKKWMIKKIACKKKY